MLRRSSTVAMVLNLFRYFCVSRTSLATCRDLVSAEHATRAFSMRQSNRTGQGNRSSNRNIQSDRRPNGAYANATSVPRTSQVVPGAEVSIVLKADQATGGEVQGIVQDLLTRGDHPRGIKVRLVDGRVGRVQRMASATSAAKEPGDEDTAPDVTTVDVGRGGTRGRGRSQGHGLSHRYRDIREEDDAYTYTEGRDQGSSLADYLDAAERRQAARIEQSAALSSTDVQHSDIAPPLATCPICNDFEGDETAVTHHVDSHFA